mmetsp:Transcript_24198/g.66238  ORF Transcript_24198/g.66238 Transcript_24198/m.66238 type:complete len:1512 (-) Transcript_24198:750-5285(-)
MDNGSKPLEENSCLDKQNEWKDSPAAEEGPGTDGAAGHSKLPAFRPFSPSSAPPADKGSLQNLSKQQRKDRKKQINAHTKAQIKAAKRNANIHMPPPEVSIFAPASTMGHHLGVGMGLYFQLLEWLMILFACLTFLSVPYWIVINQSVFTDKANKDNESVGLKVFEDPSMLSTTFASIVGHQLDPNNTLVYMNTELGSKWYGPMEKNDFLLWVSLLDVVGVVLAIFLVTYYTWKAGWFELDVDKNCYDATDYAVLVTGLPPDAGFHEIGHFFSRFGEVMDVTLVLDMEQVLKACARASKLEHKRELQQHYMRMLPTECREGAKKRMEEIEDELMQVLKDINEAMDAQIAKNKSEAAKGPLHKGSFFGSSKRNKVQHDGTSSNEGSSRIKAAMPMAEGDEMNAKALTPSSSIFDEPPSPGVVPPGQGSSRRQGFYKNTTFGGNFKRETVYATKAAFVTFNRISEQKECLKLTPNPGWSGWLYSHTVAKSAQCMRGYCIETKRACGPSDYIFENMCLSKQRRFWRRVLIRFLYLVMLIICALIVSGLSSQTRVTLNRKELDFNTEVMNSDVGRAASYLPTSAPANSAISELRGLYEEAMREAASSETTPSFSTGLASTADFTDYCTLALPEVCAEHYRESLGGEKDTPGLQMTFGKQFQWAKFFDEAVYHRPLLASLNELAKEKDPTKVEGTDEGLSACLACYCLGLAAEDKTEQKAGAWLAKSQEHCNIYNRQADVDSSTETAISIVVVVLNVALKLFVQFLSAREMQWTRSEMEMSFCVVAYTSQLLNSVLVVLLVNARPNARSTETGERVGETDIKGLRYIILDGSFDDFSAAWYEYVGTSFMILLFIQTIFPLVNICIEVILKGVQRMVVRLKRDATQDDYNNAYNHPQFLLQQRIADVMLNVSVALLFCSGMPLCAAVVILVFGVASVMDRWAITHLMTVTRYGSALPRLILGLLPWMVFLHCGFGLWMHSYFMMRNWDREATAVFVQTGKDQLEHSIRPEDAFGEYIDERNVKTRISQPNSFGLLLLAFIMFLWLFFRHVIQRWLDPILRLWVDAKMQENLEEGDDDGNRRFWVLRKILAMPKLQLPGMPDTPEDDDCMTFERAITEKRLKGMPTFRLPFHPRYADAFSGLLHSAIWSRMLGPYRYTRLVPVREEEPLTVYRVEVKTSDILGAGTDANVLLQIFGIKDGKEVSTGLHDLCSMHNDFERGNTDVFMLTVRDVGRMERIEVRSCGKGFFGYWHLEFVRITDCVRGVTLMFPCGQWLHPRRPESLVQVLVPSGDIPDRHKALHVASEEAALSLEQNPKGVCQKGVQGTLLPGAVALEEGCNRLEQPGDVSSPLGAGGVILEEEGTTEEMRTTGTMSIMEGVGGADDAGEVVEDREQASGKGQVSSGSIKENIHIEMSPGPALTAGTVGGPPPVLAQRSSPTGSASKCDTLKRQRQERLVQVKLSWKISDHLILHAKDAPLDENYGDFKQFEYGPALSSYLASMQAPESPRVEASSRLMKA